MVWSTARERAFCARITIRFIQHGLGSLGELGSDLVYTLPKSNRSRGVFIQTRGGRCASRSRRQCHGWQNHAWREGGIALKYFLLLALLLFPAVIHGESFTDRCNTSLHPGVLRCWGFDQNSDLDGYPYGSNSGSYNQNYTTGDYEANNYDGTCGPAHLYRCPEIDTSTKASGAGSMKFTMPGYGDPAGNSASAAGAWITNFTPFDGTYWTAGAGDDFYIQWRQRFDQNYVDYEYQYTAGAGPKHLDIAPGDLITCTRSNQTDCRASNIGQKIVVEDSAQRSVPIMYGPQNGAGGDGEIVKDGFKQPDTGYSDYTLQNQRGSPYCTQYYTYPGSAALGTGYGSNAHNRYPPTGNCVGYYANEWMTYKVHVHLGTLQACSGGGQCWQGSTIQFYIGREGQALELVNSGTFNPDSSHSGNDKFGKLWVMPYTTGKVNDADPGLPGFVTWFDELVISKTDIADPDAPNTGPSGSATAGKITLGGKVALH